MGSPNPLHEGEEGKSTYEEYNGQREIGHEFTWHHERRMTQKSEV